MSTIKLFLKTGFSHLLLVLLTVQLVKVNLEIKDTTALKDVPNYHLLASSHAVSTAVVLSYLGALKNDARPPEVLIGSLEARIYHCACIKKKNPTWEIAHGIKEWAALEGWQVVVDERCLKSSNPDEIAELNMLKNAITEKHPVIVSFSFDEASANDLAAAQKSPRRFSTVLTGIREREKQQELILQLPLGWDVREDTNELRKFFGVTLEQNTPAPTSITLPWPPKCPNITFTFVRELKRPNLPKP